MIEESVVIEKIAECIGIDSSKINRTTQIADLHLDSIDELDLIFKMEELKGKEIPAEIYNDIHDKSIGDLIDWVKL